MLQNTEEVPIALHPLESYGKYDFDSDETYKQGLASLLEEGAINANQPPHVRDAILRRTRVFYFNSITGYTISVEEAREYEISRPDPAQAGKKETTAGQADETRVLTLAELQELIETGKVDQIPNNKTIPDALNDAAPSESTAPVRRKPWETASE